MDDKKKLIVLGAMGVVFLGIGAFQFAKSSNSAPPAAAPAVEQSSASNDANANGDKGDILAEAPQANNLVSGAYDYRDPFKPLVDANAAPQMNPMQPPRVNNVKLPPVFNGPGIEGTGFAPPGGTAVAVVQPTIPGYRLAGVILGRRPAAVFVDPQGAQHLVQVGSSLDGDTRLVSLDRDHVVISVKGEIKNLTLGGGDSSAK